MSCSIAIRAAVVDPVGRYAYWSFSEGDTAGELSIGYKKSRVINFSNMRERTGVIDIGLKSLHCAAVGIFGTGVIHADFH